MKKQQARFLTNGHLNSRTFSTQGFKSSSCIYSFIILLWLSICFSSCNNSDQPEPEVIVPKTLNDNVRISSQQELNDFIDQKITHINGNLTLGHDASENPAFNNELINLSQLSLLTEVSGDLTILGNHELVSLEGLENLRQVGGKLVIAYNPKLTSIEAFNNLEGINGALSIEFNDNLSNVETLDNLKGVHSFTFVRNPLVTKLLDFNENSMLQEVRIEGNALLTDLTGLGGVSISDLYIAANSSLNNLEGLEATTDLQSLTLLRNENLTSLNGLGNLKSIQHNLHVEENPELIDFAGMGRLTYGPTIVRIVKNEKLESFDRFTMTPIVSDEFIWVNIQSNPELLDINPLKDLESLDQMQIYDNGKLNNLQPLSNLRYVKHLNIIYNKALTSLKGLEQLTLVEILSISGNQNLQSLEGLNNLQSASKVMHIVDNQNLTDLCALKSLAENPSLPQDQNLSFNGFNPTIEDIRRGNCSN